MNSLQFDLKELDNFNTLNIGEKRKILLLFNLNRYKFILDELKGLYDLVEDKKKLEKKISKIFNEGCLNFHITYSDFSCNIYIGSTYHLYYNNQNKKYNLCILKKPENTLLVYKGKFMLGEDLLWKRIE